MKKRKTPPRSHSPGQKNDSGFFLSFALVTLLMCGIAAWLYWPDFMGSRHTLAQSSPPRVILPPKTVPPAQEIPPPPQLTERELAQARLEDEVKQETLQEVIRANPVPPVPKTTVEPVPTIPPPPVPAPSPLPAPRASPVNDDLTPERIAAYQTVLERKHFSCGFIDGDLGMRTQRMLRAFQQNQGLPVTGLLDPATRVAIGEPGDPFITYTVSAEDLASIMPKPQGWRKKSEVVTLGYNDMWELLAEKFHCTRGYLRQLNPTVSDFDEGTQIIGPKVFPGDPVPLAASLRINLGDTSIEALNDAGQIVAFFPCSIAADKNKRPNGVLKVISVVPNPDYTFDPNLFKEAAEQENIHEKLTLPPGPRNPVGTAWIGLSLPGYGIHGTPEPENISRTQSHGCFRLANWNAETVLKMVTVGTPVEVDP